MLERFIKKRAKRNPCCVSTRGFQLLVWGGAVVGSESGGQLRWAVPLQAALSLHPAVWSFLESLHSLPLGTFPPFLRLKAHTFLPFVALGNKKKKIKKKKGVELLSFTFHCPGGQ